MPNHSDLHLLLKTIFRRTSWIVHNTGVANEKVDCIVGLINITRKVSYGLQVGPD